MENRIRRMLLDSWNIFARLISTLSCPIPIGSSLNLHSPSSRTLLLLDDILATTSISSWMSRLGSSIHHLPTSFVR